ncbi:hypothetical protein U8V72_14435 [Priestia filamentosa]|uniref:hypothetical protein n=1 Tax=Priestia filamentosa TaxID=1402861 RepID=UPI000588F334
MRIKPRHFPYPVLSNFSQDLINGTFDSNISIILENKIYIIDINFELSNIDIQEMINKNEAEFAVHIECSKTRFREVYKGSIENMKVKIPVHQLAGSVQVCLFVLTKTAIDKYYNADFHHEYKKSSFSLAKGDILAIGNERTFMAEKDDYIYKAVPSIFIITKNKERNAATIDYYLDEKIVIRLSEENYNKFSTLSKVSKEMPIILSSLVIMPVLANILEYLNGNSEEIAEYEDRRWFNVIKNKMSKIGIELEPNFKLNQNSISLAEKLLGNPLDNAFNIMESFMSER